ncbi:MAG: GlxA family transcriptional regulator [Albidovulum sp.]
MGQDQPHTLIGFLVFPGFPMGCLTSMIEPLRAANEITGREMFSWRILSEHGARVDSSAHVGFDPDLALDAADEFDFLFLLSGPMAGFADPRRSNGHLRRLARHGTGLGGVSGGVFPLARSGLLEGYSCSVHWCYEAAFAGEFPDIAMRDDVIVIDRGRYTVSGAAASFDLMLKFIETRLGEDVATEVACWFQHPLIRGEGVRQRTPTLRRESTADMLPSAVARAVQIFSSNIAEPVVIAEVARDVGLSPRQLERQFKAATGQAPSRYYRALRMNAARQLVLYSKETIARIAVAVGYETPAPLLQHYREIFGVTPQEDRRKINQIRVEGNRPLPSLPPASG